MISTRTPLPCVVAAGLAASSFVAGCWLAAPDPPSPPRPNVVVIFTDDQQFRALGCSGNDAIRTPNLDRLATHGMRFTTAFVASPVCVASRACIMSSLYPQQHGSTFLDNKPFIEKVRNGTIKTVAQHLGEAGYVTGHVLAVDGGFLAAGIMASRTPGG